MNYLSFSLWGDKPLYNIGAIRNAELWKSVYPDWTMILYYNSSVPTETIDELKKLNVTTIDMTNSPIFGPFWRFLSADLPDCKYSVFRDCDSRISEREKLAVDEWILSNKTVHIMRDHPAHGIPYGANKIGILAGMWGIKGNKVPMERMILNFIKDKVNKYGVDQTFLMTINSIYQNDNLTHDEIFSGNKFPIERKNGRFIGERININEEPFNEDWKALQRI